MHCFICPTYGHYDYAYAALESFFKYTDDGMAVVVDDAHPCFHTFWNHKWNIVSHHFSQPSGLTRSWNYGLVQARQAGAKYAICGNDDILFTPGWSAGPKALLDDETVGLVGPISNSPGLTNKKQNICDHIKKYKPSDRPEDLAVISSQLSSLYNPFDFIPVMAINGFFMIGRTARWWEGRYDLKHVFNPSQRFALVDSENEVQKRHRSYGWRSVVSPRTFIFHYRSVTRGEDYKQGMWYRMTKNHN
jgi:hypothetical protein